MALREGDNAPAFELPSSDGNNVSLKSLAGKTIVLYFYPKDNTPGCTREAEGFRDAAAKLKKKGVVVLGVSRDSVAAHCKFRDKYSLNFALLSDADHSVMEKYGAWGEKKLYGKTSLGVIRSTVLIGPDGKIKKVWPKVKVDGHVDAVLAAL